MIINITIVLLIMGFIKVVWDMKSIENDLAKLSTSTAKFAEEIIKLQIDIVSRIMEKPVEKKTIKKVAKKTK